MSDLQNDHQEADYQRLKTLYYISKKLSTFSTVEESFADILERVSECFPLSSAVLVEHWRVKPLTAVWFSGDTSRDLANKAIGHAKSAYSYLSGASLGQESELMNAVTPEKELHRNDKTLLFNKSDRGNYIIIPLIIDDLPPLGALQLEGTTSLTDKDLDFVVALANLVSVALDRYYKTQSEHASQESAARNSLKRYLKSQDKIQNLESERELREAFVSLLTHDLRTPLTIVLASAQFILRSPNDVEATKKSALRIVKSANRAGQMITDLLDANRIRSGEKLSVTLKRVDITELIQSTLTELSVIHGNRFVFNATNKIEYDVDPRGIQRIIENLCNNAIKYGSSTTPVRIELKQASTNIVISVCNEGPVISAKDQKSLFLQFRRSETAAVSSNKGWGIGLALVQGVTEAHGGNVSVKSDSTNGTVFTVTLPIRVNT